MQNHWKPRPGFIASIVVAAAMAYGWLGLAGVLPSAVAQPFTTIADVINPDDTTTTTTLDATTDTTAPDDTTVTTAPDATTDTTAPDDTTVTTAPEDTTETTVPGEEPSSRNCGRFHAGDDCQRPATPGYERHGAEADNAHGGATLESATVSHGRHGNDDEED